MNKGLITQGIVVNIVDDKDLLTNKHRLQIRVPLLHGPTREDLLPPNVRKFWIEDKYLPWYNIMYPIGTKDPNKESLFQKNEVVYVMYSDTTYKSGLIIGTTGRLINSEEYPEES